MGPELGEPKSTFALVGHEYKKSALNNQMGTEPGVPAATPSAGPRSLLRKVLYPIGKSLGPV